MPRLTDEQTVNVGSFQFSAIGIDKLSETQYTLVTLIVDITGSVSGFENDLLRMIQESVRGCKKSPRADNILLRVLTFNTDVYEVHGYRLLNQIDENADYPALRPTRATALYDATFNGLKAAAEYGKQLADQDFDANVLVIVITDGADNASSCTPSVIKGVIEDIHKNELLAGVKTILIGVNDKSCRTYLDTFKTGGGLDEYVSMGNVTPQKLAKLAGFVSKSVSSSSQSLMTGTPAATPAFTF